MSAQIPVPGTVIPIESRVSPGGARGTLGLQGIQGFKGEPGPLPVTVTAGPFIVPPIGATAVLVVEDARWVVPGQMIYVQNTGDGVAGAFRVTEVNGVNLTLLNPDSDNFAGKAVPLGSKVGTAVIQKIEELGNKILDYSTDEQATGRKWIDGRKIYQKTCSYAFTAAGHQSFNHDISNLLWVINTEATFSDPARGFFLNVAYVDQAGNANSIGFYITAGQIIIRSYRSEGADSLFTITIWYTKNE